MDMSNMKTQDFSKFGPYSTTQVINDLTGSIHHLPQVIPQIWLWV